MSFVFTVEPIKKMLDSNFVNVIFIIYYVGREKHLC